MASTVLASAASIVVGHIPSVAGGDVSSGDVVLDGDRITTVGGSRVSGSDRRFDASGLVVAPGFIDIQVNGAHGIDVTCEPQRIDELGTRLCRYGVTAFAPTVITCSPEQRAAALALAAVAAADAGIAGAVPVGLHLEGPMLAARHRGAHPERWLAAPSAELIDGWTRANGVVMVTLAPELPGALDTIEQLVAAGVVVSLGHTGAEAEHVAAAARAGATAVTHLFNAMAPFGHRAPGPVGATFADGALVASLICDAIHVDPVAVRMAWRALGPQRCVLVTDAIAALGLPPGRHRLGETIVDVDTSEARTASGTLAGSMLTLDQAVRNLVAFTGCSIDDAIATVTTTPARLLGLADRGALAPGRRADVTVLDANLRVVATFVGGELVHVAESEVRRWRS